MERESLGRGRSGHDRDQEAEFKTPRVYFKHYPQSAVMRLHFGPQGILGHKLIARCSTGEDTCSVIQYIDFNKGKPIEAWPVQWLSIVALEFY